MRYIVFFFLLAVRVHGQGLIVFYNRNLIDPDSGARYDAPVTLPDGTGVYGSAFTAGLFVARADGLELLSSTLFHEPPAGAGIFAQSQGLEVPDIPSGAPATFRVRVWETLAGSYEAAVASGRYYGEFRTKSGSSDIFIPHLGFPNPPGTVRIPDMSGIQPLTLVPEPGTLALASLGGGVILLAQKLYRRKW